MEDITHLSRFNLTQGLAVYATYAVTLVSVLLFSGLQFAPIPYIIINFLVGVALCAWLLTMLYKPLRTLPFIIVSLLAIVCSMILVTAIPGTKSMATLATVIYNSIVLPILIAIPMFVASARYIKLNKRTDDLTAEEQQYKHRAYGMILVAISIAAFALLLGISKLIGYLVFRSGFVFNLFICIFATAWMIYLLYRIDRRPIRPIKTMWYTLIVILVVIAGTLGFVYIYHPDATPENLAIYFYIKTLQPFIFLIVSYIALGHYHHNLKRESIPAEQ